MNLDINAKAKHLLLSDDGLKNLLQILEYAKGFDAKEHCMSDEQRQLIKNIEAFNKTQPNATINPEYIREQTHHILALEANYSNFEERFHEKADELMCEILVDLGFDDLVTIFNSIEKDYN